MALEKIVLYKPDIGVVEEPYNLDYRTQIRGSTNIIIKAGTDVVTREGKFDGEYGINLAQQVVELIRHGTRATIVTSGAIAMGKEKVGVERSQKMSRRSLAAIGQSLLMKQYNEIFSNFSDVLTSQFLLKGEDFEDPYMQQTKEGFDDVWNETRGIAIVNANDATWTGETNADNDELAAKLYNLLGADFAIYLTSVDGLCEKFGTEHQRLINYVVGFDPGLYNLVDYHNGKLSTGGMHSKVDANEEIVRLFGGHSVIANGKVPGVVKTIMNGAEVGTYFMRQQQKLSTKQ